MSRGVKPPREMQKVNVDFPAEFLRRIDAQAARLGVSRQAYIKLRLGDVIDQVEASTRCGSSGSLAASSSSNSASSSSASASSPGTSPATGTSPAAAKDTAARPTVRAHR